MSHHQSIRQILKALPIVAAGNMLYALTVKLFLLPANLVTGGTTGIALTVQHLWNMPISAFVLAFNIVMLILGWTILGRGFAINTVASSLLYPVFLDAFDKLLNGVVLTDDLLLCTVFGGLGIGLALGMVIRAGASTGGMDIPPLALKKLCRIPVSVSMYAFDSGILLMQAWFRPAENILYGIIMTLIYTVVLDKMQILGTMRTEVKIVSEKSGEICEAILHQVDRGVTLLEGEGGYLHGQTRLVLSVISNRELIKVEKLVHDIDPECFMVVSRVSEVRGRGFTIKKKYQ